MYVPFWDYKQINKMHTNKQTIHKNWRMEIVQLLTSTYIIFYADFVVTHKNAAMISAA